MSNAKLGENNPKYKENGSKCVTKCGKFTYIKIKQNGLWCYEHRSVMENFLGRPLKKQEIVHHKNGDTTDNRISNLSFFSSVGLHMKYHLCGVPKSEPHKIAIKKNHWRK